MSVTQLDRYIDGISEGDMVLFDGDALQVISTDNYGVTVNLEGSDLYLSYGAIAEEYEFGILEARSDELQNDAIDYLQHN